MEIPPRRPHPAVARRLAGKETGRPRLLLQFQWPMLAGDVLPRLRVQEHRRRAGPLLARGIIRASQAAAVVRPDRSASAAHLWRCTRSRTGIAVSNVEQ